MPKHWHNDTGLLHPVVDTNTRGLRSRISSFWSPLHQATSSPSGNTHVETTLKWDWYNNPQLNFGFTDAHYIRSFMGASLFHLTCNYSKLDWYIQVYYTLNNSAKSSFCEELLYTFLKSATRGRKRPIQAAGFIHSVDQLPAEKDSKILLCCLTTSMVKKAIQSLIDLAI